MKLTLPTPTPRQREFLHDTHRYIAFGGARGGGKSFASSIGEAELMQKIAMLEKEKAELESRKAEAAPIL